MEYACRALAQLAKCADAGQLTRLDDLAQREAVSANFLVQILNDLRRAGIIESRRGMSGGYLLAGEPQSITLRQIVEAVDPSLLQASVSAGGESGAAVLRVWKQVGGDVVAALDGVTLAQMSEDAVEPMFHI
ncbi:MAG: RrF2 family transcriptional regulator [Luteolibacter sp.]